MDPKTTTALRLRRAAEYIKAVGGYHNLKSAQLLEALADLLIAEAMIDAWKADLGTNGCIC